METLALVFQCLTVPFVFGMLYYIAITSTER